MDNYKVCAKCGIELNGNNWTGDWKVFKIKICDNCCGIWAIESQHNDNNVCAPPDKPYASSDPIRSSIAKRDVKYKQLNNKCSICGVLSDNTIRHHLWYPIDKYDPNSIIEVCHACHCKIHTGRQSMPII